VSEQSGFRLPPEEELARQYCVSRNTMREALALLVEEGVLRRRRGVGTQLVVERHAREYGTGAGLAASLPRLASQIANVNLDLEIVPSTPHLRSRFGVEEDFFVYWERLTLVGLDPQAIWRSHLPARAFASLVDEPPSSEKSIYDVVREITGTPVARTRRTVEARAMDPMTARHLRVPSGTAALHIERSMYSADGRLVELGYAWARGDRYAVTYDTELEGHAAAVEPRPHLSSTSD
jgi:GntR family transcriptional regulator